MTEMDAMQIYTKIAERLCYNDLEDLNISMTDILRASGCRVMADELQAQEDMLEKNYGYLIDGAISSDEYSDAFKAFDDFITKNIPQYAYALKIWMRVEPDSAALMLANALTKRAIEK